MQRWRLTRRGQPVVVRRCTVLPCRCGGAGLCCELSSKSLATASISHISSNNLGGDGAAMMCASSDGPPAPALTSSKHRMTSLTLRMTSLMLVLLLFALASPTNAATQKRKWLSHLPKNITFSCEGRTPGYYADQTTGCQMYHMCDPQSRRYSYLCPALTAFDQFYMTCARHERVNCSQAQQFYHMNEMIGKPRVNFHQHHLSDGSAAHRHKDTEGTTAHRKHVKSSSSTTRARKPAGKVLFDVRAQLAAPQRKVRPRPRHRPVNGTRSVATRTTPKSDDSEDGRQGAASSLRATASTAGNLTVGGHKTSPVRAPHRTATGLRNTENRVAPTTPPNSYRTLGRPGSFQFGLDVMSKGQPAESGRSGSKPRGATSHRGGTTTTVRPRVTSGSSATLEARVTTRRPAQKPMATTRRTSHRTTTTTTTTRRPMQKTTATTRRPAARSRVTTRTTSRPETKPRGTQQPRTTARPRVTTQATKRTTTQRAATTPTTEKPKTTSHRTKRPHTTVRPSLTTQTTKRTPQTLHSTQRSKPTITTTEKPKTTRPSQRRTITLWPSIGSAKKSNTTTRPTLAPTTTSKSTETTRTTSRTTLRPRTTARATPRATSRSTNKPKPTTSSTKRTQPTTVTTTKPTEKSKVTTPKPSVPTNSGVKTASSAAGSVRVGAAPGGGGAAGPLPVLNHLEPPPSVEDVRALKLSLTISPPPVPADAAAAAEQPPAAGLQLQMRGELVSGEMALRQLMVNTLKPTYFPVAPLSLQLLPPLVAEHSTDAAGVSHATLAVPLPAGLSAPPRVRAGVRVSGTADLQSLEWLQPPDNQLPQLPDPPARTATSDSTERAATSAAERRLAPSTVTEKVAPPAAGDGADPSQGAAAASDPEPRKLTMKFAALKKHAHSGSADDACHPCMKAYIVDLERCDPCVVIR